MLRVVDLGLFGGGLSGFAEEGEDDLDLFGGEEFAFGGVGGSGEFVHQWLIGVDFTGEEFSCALLICSPLTLSKLHWSFFTIGEVGHGKVLLEHKLRHK